eukprot:TRINITY_DN3729_c0_g1_i2.p1 TRINITY_DN3729_c0_g1~~TRINITY_DN3729_c0_g1_i2.p1  ORF type:complete len:112 (+),score=25.05 TRINITY_DN3729_c0_g1_i2:52-387(+)
MDFATTDTNPLVDLSQDRSEDLSTSEEEDQHLSWSARLFSMNKPEKHSKANKQQAVVQAQKELLKFSRMTTHLANERTLLAWVSFISSPIFSSLFESLLLIRFALLLLYSD